MKSRLRILIYPRFQLLLLGINFLVFAIVSGVMFWQHQRTQGAIRQLGLDANLSPSHGFFQLVELQSQQYLASLTAVMLFGFIFSALVMLVVSNRLAGPIVRLRRYFGDIAIKTDNVPPLSFRKGDFFGDLPEVVNRAVQALQTKK